MKPKSSDRPAAAPTSADEALLELVQRQSFGYFWDFAHPGSWMARDRGYSNGTVRNDLALGGTGFGIMAMIVAVERGWIARDDAVSRLLRMLAYLGKADSYQGVFPHFLDGATGKEMPLWDDNAGSDIVETSYLVAGFCVCQVFDRKSASENKLRAGIANLWENANWSCHTKDGGPIHWHLRPGRPQAQGRWLERMPDYLCASLVAHLSY